MYSFYDETQCRCIFLLMKKLAWLQYKKKLFMMELTLV
jgi:hypothetical protein